MNKPLVSVLVPVYNTEKYIQECLESIVGQIYRPLQVIIINDGSTDSSEHICKQFADKYPFVEYCSQTNAGVATTRNRLIEKIKGDYFLFVDSDDWIELEMINFLVNKAEENDADIVTCGLVRDINKFSQQYTEQSLTKEDFIKKFLYHKELNGSLGYKLIKTSLTKGVSFDPRISYGEDALFLWGCLQNANSLILTNKPFYHYRPNPKSLSRQKWTPKGKGTGHLVWESICRDVEKSYPQFIDIAYSRYAFEDMWALYFASLCGYKHDEQIKLRQKNIRNHTREIKKHPIEGRSKMWTAIILSRCYWTGKLIRLIKS